MQNLKNKPFQEVPGGQYDHNGFYYTPDGSFWDPDGVYFNPEGYDSHGGYYDDNLEYCPGPGWIDELMCYEEDKAEVLRNLKFGGGRRIANQNNLPGIDEDDVDDDGDEDDIYEEIDYEKLMQEEEKKIHKNENTEDNTNKINAEGDQAREEPKRKVFNPRNYIHSHVQHTGDVNNENNRSELQQNKAFVDNDVKDSSKEKENVVITPDMLFNKIPENLKPKNIDKATAETQEPVKKIETKIEVDSLFG